jgi:hypothetical protein
MLLQISKVSHISYAFVRKTARLREVSGHLCMNWIAGVAPAPRPAGRNFLLREICRTPWTDKEQMKTATSLAALSPVTIRGPALGPPPAGADEHWQGNDIRQLRGRDDDIWRGGRCFHGRREGPRTPASGS